MWFIFALTAAFSNALYFALSKKFLKNTDPYALGAGASLATALMLFIAAYVKGFPEIGDRFFTSVVATGIINVIATILMYKSLQKIDLSVAAPMISFTPAFLILTSYILLKELPSAFGIIGILLIVSGSYVLNIENGVRGIFAPFKRMWSDKGIFMMLIVAMLYSISINFDKLIVLNSDAIFGSAAAYLFIGTAFLILATARRLPAGYFVKSVPAFFASGAALALGAIMINTAFTMQIVPYAVSIKRLSSLFSVILGWLFFKEKSIGKKMLGAAIMIVGTVIIVLA